MAKLLSGRKKIINRLRPLHADRGRKASQLWVLPSVQHCDVESLWEQGAPKSSGPSEEMEGLQ